MELSTKNSWYNFLKSEFEKEYFIELTNFISNEYKTKTIYPAKENIFNTFEFCNFDELKVVILGQDPYHNKGQANGLCFAVNRGVALPRSLKNIYLEIVNDLGSCVYNEGNLEDWAKQGILLLNTILTVRENEPASHHNKGWEVFTDSVIRKISKQKENIIFLLWGNFAQTKAALIDSEKHLILKAAHPSPFSARRGFFGCKHFSKTNEFLRKCGKKEIVW